MALYFHTMSLSKSNQIYDGELALAELAKLVYTYSYTTLNSVTNVEKAVLQSSSYSLLGYACRELGRDRHAARAFKKSYKLCQREAARTERGHRDHQGPNKPRW